MSSLTTLMNAGDSPDTPEILLQKLIADTNTAVTALQDTTILLVEKATQLTNHERLMGTSSDPGHVKLGVGFERLEDGTVNINGTADFEASMNTHQTDPIAHGISVETKPNAVPKAGADGKLDAGWLPESQPPVPAPHVITHEPGGADTLARLGPVTEQAQNLGTISGTVAVNLSLGLSISATIGGATNFLFSGVPTGGSAIVVMRLTNAGNHAITWPSIIWAGAGNPMFTANGRDLVAIITDNGGSLWWGCVTFEY